MKKRFLGNDKLEVSAIGLGCMGMSNGFGDPKDEKEMCNLLAEAVDMGVTMFDTAEAYGEYQNEELLGKGLSPYRNKIVLATKCGMKMVNGKGIINNDPDVLRSSLEGSLRRLKTDYIDLYYLHRIDPKVPIEETAELMNTFKKEGKIGHWGLSEANPEMIRRAHAVFPVTAVESEYSMMWRKPEEEVIPILEELGIALVPFSPLCKGFLSGLLNKDSKFASNDNRSHYSRFKSENLDANQVLIDLIQSVAEKKNASVTQISLAWLLAQKPWIVPIPGTTKIYRLQENIAATEIELTREEVTALTNSLNQIKIAGERF